MRIPCLLAVAAVVLLLVSCRTAPPGARANLATSRTPNLAIPDKDTAGVTDSARLSPPEDFGTLKSIRVHLNVTHPRPRDLEVSLVDPQGTTIRLHRQTGDKPDLVASYPDQSSPSEPLTKLIGTRPDGTWKLEIRDLKQGESGKLNSWGLDLQFNYR
jgi:subtilisin-like proprotein convertase family protein